MNECREAVRLGAYHDGEMVPGARADFEQHLARCVHCRAELERVRALTGVLGRAALPDVPPAVLDRLHGAVDALPAVGLRRMAWALSAAAAAVLAVCLIGPGRQTLGGRSAPAMPVWEAAAVAQQSREHVSAGAEEVFAAWVVQDLSWKNDHD